MIALRAYVRLGLVVACLLDRCACASRSASHQQDGVLSSPTRQLQQSRNSDFSLKYADFSMLPANIPVNNTVGEKALRGNINVTTNALDPINQPYDVPFGAFHLDPIEVEQIIMAVTTQLNKVPPAQADTFVVRPQTRRISGKSVLGKEGLRVATIFAPQYSGSKFRVEGVEQPPGTVLELRNMTIVLPNGTFDAGPTMNLQGSGLMDYFEMGTGARVCILNRTCITYTQAAYAGLGNSRDPLDLLSCRERAQEVTQGEEISAATFPLMWQGIGVHVAAALCLLLLA